MIRPLPVSVVNFIYSEKKQNSDHPVTFKAKVVLILRWYSLWSCLKVVSLHMIVREKLTDITSLLMQEFRELLKTFK